MIILPYSQWILTSSPTIPKLYWEVKSSEQRILEICRRIHGLEMYADYLSSAMVDLREDIARQLADVVVELRAMLDDALADIAATVDEELAELRDWVEEQTFTHVSWDVTHGTQEDGVIAMRNLFADVTTDGTTVDRLAASQAYPTVDSLASSGWNVRALAVIGETVLGTENQQQWHV